MVIELKKVAAERLQAQGVAIQEDSITDEMLFDKISTDSNLRSSLTLWLRARGYVSSMVSARPGILESDEDAGPEYSYSQARPPITGSFAGGYGLPGMVAGVGQEVPADLQSLRTSVPSAGGSSAIRETGCTWAGRTSFLVSEPAPIVTPGSRNKVTSCRGGSTDAF